MNGWNVQKATNDRAKKKEFRKLMPVYLSCTAQGIQLVTKVYHTFLKKNSIHDFGPEIKFQLQLAL